MQCFFMHQSPLISKSLRTPMSRIKATKANKCQANISFPNVITTLDLFNKKSPIVGLFNKGLWWPSKVHFQGEKRFENSVNDVKTNCAPS